MKAAIYARVSTDKQGRDQTIDSQLDALRRWVTTQGHELKDDPIYIDEGYSGARLDRTPSRANSTSSASTAPTDWPGATPIRSDTPRSSRQAIRA